MELKFSKAKQIGKKKKSLPRVTVKEEETQQLVNETLQWMHIENIRVPDAVWAWLKYNSPAHVVSTLAKGTHDNGLAGMADNVCFIPISDKYSLCMHLELKTEKGKLHGKQKRKAGKLPYQVAHNPDEALEMIEQFQIDAKDMQKKGIEL